MRQGARPVPSDYDSDPHRFRLARDVLQRHGRIPHDVHPGVAARLAADGLNPVLDMGCGDGRLMRLLADSGLWAVGLDRSVTMLSQAPPPAIRGDGGALSFKDETFGAVAALYVLY